MSELDKEAVLDEFTAAYKNVHNKKPKVADSNGWYSVDGGKNMRLAQLDEWTQELKNGSAGTAKKSTAKSKQKPAKKKTATKRKAGQASGNTPAQAWQTHLDQQAGDSRYPRGFKPS